MYQSKFAPDASNEGSDKMDAERIAKIAAEVEELSGEHLAAQDAEWKAQRAATAALNALRTKQKEFDKIVDDFKNSGSDGFNNRWCPKFRKLAEAMARDAASAM